MFYKKTLWSKDAQRLTTKRKVYIEYEDTNTVIHPKRECADTFLELSYSHPMSNSLQPRQNLNNKTMKIFGACSALIYECTAKFFQLGWLYSSLIELFLRNHSKLVTFKICIITV